MSTYYLRKRSEGKSHKEAMRCLKRRLSDVVYRQLRRDANRLEAGPGRTLGGGSVVQRGQLKPRTLTLRTSHFPDPPAATIQPTNTGLLTQRGAVYTLPVVRWWGAVLTEGYPHHIPTSKSQPATCLLPGIDTSGGREWFNPNRVWTPPPVRAVILLGWRAGPL